MRLQEPYSTTDRILDSIIILYDTVTILNLTDYNTGRNRKKDTVTTRTLYTSIISRTGSHMP